MKIPMLIYIITLNIQLLSLHDAHASVHRRMLTQALAWMHRRMLTQSHA